MPCCLFYCHLASQLDPKPFKRVSAFWFSYTKKKKTKEGPQRNSQKKMKMKIRIVMLRDAARISGVAAPFNIVCMNRYVGYRQ